MPSLKCPSCGFRILLPANTDTCPNCNEPFITTSTRTTSRITSTSLGHADDIVVKQEPSLLPSLPSSSKALQRVVPSRPEESDISSMQRTISLMPTSAELMPYEIDIKIPSQMPKQKPDLYGVLINQQVQHEVARSAGVGVLILRQFRDIIWPIREPQHYQERKVTVTTIRIHTISGDQRDARFEGDTLGGSLTLGDTFSLWGHKRKGTLIVKRAFNHTSQAEVPIRSQLAAQASSIALLILLFALVIVMLLWNHWLILSPTPHLQIPPFWKGL